MGIVTKINAGSTTHLIASSAYGTCTTAAETAAKVVTLSNFDTLTAGMTIHVRFTNSNTASSPTLNVNSTGAKTIYAYGTTAPGTSVNSSWQAGAVVSFTYNTDNNSNGCWVMNDYIQNSNNYVTQTASTDTGWHKILGTYNSNTSIIGSATSGTTTTVYYKNSNGPALQPSTGIMYAPQLYINLETSEDLYTNLTNLGWTDSIKTLS